MTEFIISETDDGFEYPSYKDPGDILVRVGDPNVPKTWEVLDYDSGSSCFYMDELGFRYLFEEYWSDLFEAHPPGVYVIEGSTGAYFRGDGWTTDDDAEFYPGTIRPATDDEIRGEGLGPTIDPENDDDDA